MRITLKTDGLKEAEQRIGKLVVRSQSRTLLDNPRVLLEFRASSARRFARGLRQAGRRWRLEKRRRGLIDRPMRASGDAHAALTRGSGPRARAVIFRATGDGVRFGVLPGRSELWYLQALARGYKTSHGRVTPRRVVVLDRVAKERVAHLVLERLED